MSFFQKAANLAHKTAVSGLVGSFVYGLYVVGGQVSEGRDVQTKENHPQAGYIQMLKDKAQEEYNKYYDIDHREWYDEDDDSYLKNLPKKEDYAPKKK